MRDFGPTLLFDSECLLCLGTVRFLAARDDGYFRFGALASEKAQAILRNAKVSPETDSIVLVEKDTAYVRSDAVIRVLAHVRGWRWLGKLLSWCPRGLRDALYYLVARNRRRFTKTERCDVPSPELRARMI